MKKLFATLLGRRGQAQTPATPAAPQQIDPRTILFSTPTLADDLPPLLAVDAPPGEADLLLHEDDWSQVEFFTHDRVGELQQMLTAYAEFEQAQREPSGWRELYVRKLARRNLLAARPAHTPAQLQALLGSQAGPAPLLYASDTVTGRVAEGFTLPLGGNITLYGYADGPALPLLGAHVGAQPDNAVLTRAFLKLHATYGLVLVDWRAQMILTAASAEGNIDLWRP